MEVGYDRMRRMVAGYGKSMRSGRLEGAGEDEESEGAVRAWAEADRWMQGRRERAWSRGVRRSEQKKINHCI